VRERTVGEAWSRMVRLPHREGRKRSVSLTGRPIYLKLVLDQGYWPESLLTPPTDAAIQYDIKMTKEMGFNGARKHQKLEDPVFSTGPTNWVFSFRAKWPTRICTTRTTPRATRASGSKRSSATGITRPFVIWNPINESWGVPDLSQPRQQQHLRSLYTLTKSLDETRLVIDNEGWEHTEMTDLFAVHDYARDEQTLGPRWMDFGKPGVALPGRSRHWLVPGVAYNGTPLYLFRVRRHRLHPGRRQGAGKRVGLLRRRKTADAALERLRGLYRAVARSPSPHLLHPDTDVEQEINGLMTYDRKLKFDPKVLREINNMLR